MKKLEEMSLEELWELFPIVLTPPDPNWKEWAESEMEFLRDLLRPIRARLYHIGSTAICGILSKPIIDIIVSVEDSASFGLIKKKLTGSNYICMSESPGRLSFNKGYTPQGYAEKVFHIHLRTSDDTDEVYFRDYLNAHPEVAKEYESLKLSLSKCFEHDRDAYTRAKTSFVRHYTDIAKNFKS